MLQNNIKLKSIIMLRIISMTFYFILNTLFSIGQENLFMDDFWLLKVDKGWSLEFKDSGTGEWKDNWFLDGLKANVVNTREGMVFSAGEIDGDPACHGVLWTKKGFRGDVKIEYDYTRLDTMTHWVNILYIQATGIGKKPYSKDIEKWNNLREVPSMGLYFNYMNTFSISYAAKSKAYMPDVDYIRARRYHPTAKDGLTGTEIVPTYHDTGLFIPGKKYHITVIKDNDTLFFNVKGDGIEKLFFWDISDVPPIRKGRIGLRHMFTRTSRYTNFQVYAK